MIKMIFLLVFGMIILIYGASLLVSSSKSIARLMHVSPFVIGLTMVSISTSIPEMSVNIVASIKNSNDIALGNIVGSNIFDILGVIGASALIFPMLINKNIKKYEIPCLLLTYITLIMFMFVITPYNISRIEGIILLVLSIIYTIFLVYRSKGEMNDIEEVKKEKWYKILIFFILGILGVVYGSKFVVSSSKSIAEHFHMSELLISLTIVSVGTSLPEVVTSVVAAKKKEYDIAIGNAIGSCIFNILLIIGLSSVIRPIAFHKDVIFDVVVMSLCPIIILFFRNKINRFEGALLIAIYIGYLVYIILRN